MPATEKNVHASDLHFNHVLWKNQLSFYKEELSLFQNRLDEVSAKNTATEMKLEQDHLQNQITIQKNEIDTLKHALSAHENELAKHAKENPIASDHELFGNHKQASERMERFTTLYTEFKKELMRFLSVWM